MTVILINCITLAMYQPCNQPCTDLRCFLLEVSDRVIFAFFALEMTVKVIAMGFLGKNCYLGDPWNRLDLFIVLAGAVEYAVNVDNLNLTAIRTVRVLRPIRAINRIPSLRILVTLLLDTLPMLGNVLLLCFFVFFIFGIVGVQLWSGLLTNRCFLSLPPNVSSGDLDLPPYFKDGTKDFICTKDSFDGMTTCTDLPNYMVNRVVCNLSANNSVIDRGNLSDGSCINWNQYYTDCKSSDQNPFYGAISFDNIGLAWVAIFQVISLAGWVNIMYYIQDAHSFWDWIYFVLLIIVGSFFMINLCLVVIATQFSETKKREMERMIMERKRFHSSSTLASNSEPGGCYDEILKYIAHLFRKGRRRFNRWLRRRARTIKPLALSSKRTKKLKGKKRRRRRERTNKSNSSDKSSTAKVEPSRTSNFKRAQRKSLRRQNSSKYSRVSSEEHLQSSDSSEMERIDAVTKMAGNRSHDADDADDRSKEKSTSPPKVFQLQANGGVPIGFASVVSLFSSVSVPSPTPALRLISSPPSDSRTSSICSEFSGKYLLVPIEIVRPLKSSEGAERTLGTGSDRANTSGTSGTRRHPLTSIDKAASFNCETCGNFLPIVQIEESFDSVAGGQGARRRVSINRAMSLNAAPSALRLSGHREDLSGSFPTDRKPSPSPSPSPSPNHLHPQFSQFSTQNRRRLSRVVRAASLNAGNISPTGKTAPFLPVMQLVDKQNIMASALKSRSAKLLLLHGGSSSTDSNPKVDRPGASIVRVGARASLSKQLSVADERRCFINRAASWNSGISLRAPKEESRQPPNENVKKDPYDNNAQSGIPKMAAARRRLSFLKASSAQTNSTQTLSKQTSIQATSMSCDEPYHNYHQHHHHHHHQQHQHHHHQHLLHQQPARPQQPCRLKIPPIIIGSASRNCSISSGTDQLSVAQFLPKDKSFYGSNLNVDPCRSDSIFRDKIQTCKESFLGLKGVRGEKRQSQVLDRQSLCPPPTECAPPKLETSFHHSNDSRNLLTTPGSTNFLTVPSETVNVPRMSRSQQQTLEGVSVAAPGSFSNHRTGILRASSICESELISQELQRQTKLLELPSESRRRSSIGRASSLNSAPRDKGHSTGGKDHPDSSSGILNGKARSWSATVYDGDWTNRKPRRSSHVVTFNKKVSKDRKASSSSQGRCHGIEDSSLLSADATLKKKKTNGDDDDDDVGGGGGCGGRGGDDDDDDDDHVKRHCGEGGSFEDSDSSDEEQDDDDDDDDDEIVNVYKVFWGQARMKIKKFVNCDYYQRGVLVAIVVNTLSMGIEYHNQPEILNTILEFSNVMFTCLFAIEMFMKILADGPLQYIKNGFNIFDGFIVTLSVSEVVQGGASGLSVLRTFRLLRILKLVRFMPALRYQLLVMLRTIENVAVFFSLLAIFIFIFSILGMNLFGCKFCDTIGETSSRRKCRRKNFDTLLWAIITVFQILTQEDWHEVLYIGMSTTSRWAALYFITLMTFGNYVLFNLLVAILVEGFSAEAEAEEKKKEEERLENKRRRCKIKDINMLQERGSILAHKSFDDDLTSSNLDDIKNNREKEKIMFGRCGIPGLRQPKMTRGASAAKESEVDLDPSLNAPIITHTAATPMGSPQGSPNDCPSTIVEFGADPLVQTVQYLTVSQDLSTQSESFENLPQVNEEVLKSTWFGSIRPEDSHTRDPKAMRRFLSDSHVMPMGIDVTNNMDVPAPAVNIEEDLFFSSAETGKENFGSSVMASNYLQETSNAVASCVTAVTAASQGNKHLRPLLTLDIPPTQISDPLPRCILPHSSSERGSTFILNNQRTLPSLQCSPLPIMTVSSATTPAATTTTNATGQVLHLHAIPTVRPSLARQQTISSAHNVSKLSLCLNNSVNMAGEPPVQQEAVDLEENPISRTVRHDELNYRFNQHPLSDQSESRFEETAIINNCNKGVDGDDEDDDDDAKYDFMDFCQFFCCNNAPSWLMNRYQHSLFLLSPDNRIRKFCSTLTTSSRFDLFILSFIVLNSITLAMERPDITLDSLERQMLNVSNFIFTLLFLLEMMIKVLAKGLVIGRHAYLKSSWNIMDGALVCISVVDVLILLTASNSRHGFGILRVLRLLRALRPLRVISRAPGLKLVVQTLLSSLRPIGNIVLICCTFFIIFGILGVQLFKGTFYHCEGPNITDIMNKTDCINRGVHYRWVNSKYNFDNLGQALMALFVLASKDGWVNIMYTGLDAVGVDKQPQENHNEYCLVYFISFLLLVGFFVLNMFVGVVVENFHKCRESQEQEERARREARHAKKLEQKKKKLLEAPYWSNYSKGRLWIHTVVCSKYFDLAIACVIFTNVITMSIEYYQMPKVMQQILKVFNYFFTSIFVLEALIKVVALGAMRYISDRWNKLDMAIVILSLVGIILDEMGSEIMAVNPTLVRVVRVMRIARVLKLLKVARSVRALLDTVMQALPEVINLGLLFFLLFYIFAALAVELFGRVECSQVHPCEGLGKHAHFQNFGMALLTLFRVATGDNWNGIMKDTLRDDCDSSDDCTRNCCVSRIIAPVFFVVFVLMAQFVLVNVVVAVLMKHLEESHKHIDEFANLEAEVIQEIEAEEARRLALLKVQRYDVESLVTSGSRVRIASSQLDGTPFFKEGSPKLLSTFAINVCPPSPEPASSRYGRHSTTLFERPIIRTESRLLFSCDDEGAEEVDGRNISRSTSVHSRDQNEGLIDYDDDNDNDGHRRQHSMSQQQLTMDSRCRSISSVRGGSFRSLKGHRLFRQDAVSNSSTPESTPRLLSPADAYHVPVAFAFESQSRATRPNARNSLEEDRRSRVRLLTRTLSHQLPPSVHSGEADDPRLLQSNNALDGNENAARLSLPPSGLQERRVSFRRSRSGVSSPVPKNSEDSFELSQQNPDQLLVAADCFDPFPRLQLLRPPRLEGLSSNQETKGREQNPSYPLLSVNRSPSPSLSNLSPSARPLGFFPRSPSNFKADCFFVFPPVIPEEQGDKFDAPVRSSSDDEADAAASASKKNVPFDHDRRVELPPPPSSSSSSSSLSTSSSLHFNGQPRPQTSTTSSHKILRSTVHSKGSPEDGVSAAPVASVGADRVAGDEGGRSARVARGRMMLGSNSRVVYDSEEG